MAEKDAQTAMKAAIGLALCEHAEQTGIVPSVACINIATNDVYRAINDPSIRWALIDMVADG